MQLLQLGIDFGSLPWQAIGLLAALAFVSSLIGHSVTDKPFIGAIFTTILFVVIYIAWDFYPHGYLPNLRFPYKY